MKDQNRARMMNQQNKAAWLASRIEDGSINTQQELVAVCAKIYASGKILSMTQDYYKALPAR